MFQVTTASFRWGSWAAHGSELRTSDCGLLPSLVGLSRSTSRSITSPAPPLSLTREPACPQLRHARHREVMIPVTARAQERLRERALRGVDLVGQPRDRRIFSRWVQSFLRRNRTFIGRKIASRIPKAKVVRSNRIGGAISRHAAPHPVGPCAPAAPARWSACVRILHVAAARRASPETAGVSRRSGTGGRRRSRQEASGLPVVRGARYSRRRSRRARRRAGRP